MSVCLFVSSDLEPKVLDGTKFGMGHPMDPEGNLKILFWVDPPEGDIPLEKLKRIQTFPIQPRTAGGFLLRHLLRLLLNKHLNIIFWRVNLDILQRALQSKASKGLASKWVACIQLVFQKPILTLTATSKPNQKPFLEVLTKVIIPNGLSFPV